ncbi:MAG: peptidoglycan-binding domain-containing protein [Spirochaetales bacterium]|nr:peptidoglycan-binding domain-containing protein [Spirochaetales bacterium]
MKTGTNGTCVIKLVLFLIFLSSGLSAQDVMFTRELKLESPRLHGADVEFIQMRLSELNYEVGEIDGWFGPLTEEAVKQMQRDFNFEPDGAVDLNLWKFIGNDRVFKFKEISDQCDVTDVDDSLEINRYNNEFFDEERGHNVSRYITTYSKKESVFKIQSQFTGDGSGYRDSIYYDNDGNILKLTSVWWIYDFESHTDINGAVESFYFDAGKIIGLNDEIDKSWSLYINDKDRDRAVKIRQEIESALSEQ